MSQSWMIASGKGGVGKSTIAACLAIGLAVKGESVVIIDTDIGLRNMDAILGLENNIVFDICDVVEKECKLFDALVAHPGYESLYLLPAAQFRRVKAIDNNDLSKIVRKLKAKFAHVIVDCPAGIERGFHNAINATDAIILVTTPDDMTIRDVEQAANLLMRKRQPRPQLIVNRISPKHIKSGDMYTAHTISGILDLELLGAVPNDEAIYDALLSHRSPMETKGDAQKAIMRIIGRMQGKGTPVPPMGIEKKRFWEKLFGERR